MNSLFRRAAVVFLAALLVGCATNQFTTITPAEPGLSIRNSKVFGYSFLDIRDAEFGPTMLSQIDSQLTQMLEKSNVSFKVLRFKNSEAARYYAATGGSMTVPVGQTILSNLKEEQTFGADYRLVIFPSKMSLVGAWKHYDVRWDLIDVKTGKRVWASTSYGKHLTMWRNDEEPEMRAKMIVDGAIAEMKKGGLI